MYHLQDFSAFFHGNRNRFLVIVCLFEFESMSSLSTTQIIYYSSIENSFKRIYSDVDPLRLCRSSFSLYLLVRFFPIRQSTNRKRSGARATKHKKKHEITERYVAGGGFEFDCYCLTCGGDDDDDDGSDGNTNKCLFSHSLNSSNADA